MDKNEHIQTRTLLLFDTLIVLRVILDDIKNVLITIFFPFYLLIQIFKKAKNKTEKTCG